MNTFKLLDFNPRRYARGAEAARMECFEDGVSIGTIWMSRGHIKKNLALWPSDAGLLAAREAYKWPSIEIRDGARV